MNIMNLSRDISIFALANIFSKLAAFLFLPFITLKISPEEFGIYDSFLVIVAFLNSFLSFGLDSGTANYLANHSNNLGLLKALYSFTVYVVITNMCLVGIILVVLNKFEIDILKISSAQSYLLLWIYSLLQYLNYVSFNFLRWTGKANVSAAMNSIISILSYSFGVLLVLIYRPDSKSLVLGLIVGNMIGLGIYMYFSINYLTIRIGRRYFPLIRRLIILSFPFTPMSLSKTAFVAIERSIVSGYLNNELFGYYTILNRVGRIPMFLYSSINSAVHPYLFNSFGSKKTRELSRKIYNLSLITAVLVFIILSLFELDILNIFNISKIPNHLLGIMPLVFIGQFVLALRSLFSNGFLLSGKTYLQLFIMLGGIVLLYLVGNIIIESYGVGIFVIFITLLSVFVSALSIYISENLRESGINKHVLLVAIILVLVIKWVL